MLEAGLPVELVPLDVTRRVVLAQTALAGAAASRSRPASPASSSTSPCTGFAFGGEREGGGIVAPRPAGRWRWRSIPRWSRFEPLHVEVECEGRLTRGLSLADRRPVPAHGQRAPNCRVAMDVDAARFLRLFLERLCPASA